MASHFQYSSAALRDEFVSFKHVMFIMTRGVTMSELFTKLEVGMVTAAAAVSVSLVFAHGSATKTCHI